MRYMACLILIVFVATPVPLFAGSGAGTVRNNVTASKQPGVSPVPPRSSRLKFRSGPTCMCGSGLSEAQINAAEQAREQETLQNKKTIGEQ